MNNIQLYPRQYLIDQQQQRAEAHLNAVDQLHFLVLCAAREVFNIGELYMCESTTALEASTTLYTLCRELGLGFVRPLNQGQPGRSESGLTIGGYISVVYLLWSGVLDVVEQALDVIRKNEGEFPEEFDRAKQLLNELFDIINERVCDLEV